MRSPNIMKVLAKSREIFFLLFFSGQREGVVLVLLREKEIKSYCEQSIFEAVIKIQRFLVIVCK